MDSRIICAAMAVLGLVFSQSAHGELSERIEKLWQARLYDQAYQLLQDAVAKNGLDGTAHNLLARSYAEGLGAVQDPVRRMRHIRMGAQAGNAEAMYALGEAYANGDGAAQSAMSAAYWFEKAAADHPMAAFRYAEIQLANRGALQGAHDPITMLRYAADEGVAPAQYLLARLMVAGEVPMTTGDDPAALLQAAAEGLPDARTALGVIEHRAGRHEQAAEAFRAAHANGSRRAAAYLGHYAEAGIGRPIERQHALTYYREASDIAWAREGATRIERHLRSPEILGFRVYGATRGEVAEALTARGIERADGEAHFDAYDISELFPEAAQAVLTAAYAPGRPAFLAELHYRIDAESTRELRRIWMEIDEALERRFGSAASHTTDRDAQIKTWRIEGTEIRLRTAPRDTRVHLTYHMVPFVDQLEEVLRKRSGRTGETSHVF